MLLLLPFPAQADSTERLLLLYMTADGEMNERVVMAEANLSAFVDSIDMVEAENIVPGSAEIYQHIVLIGDTEDKVSDNVLHELQNFTGTFLVFGHNAEQFPQFQEWEFPQEKRIGSVESYLLDTSKAVVQAIPPTGAVLLAEAKTIEQSIPFIVKHKNISFVATTAFGTDEKYVLSRALYSIFDLEPPATHPAYIRLEGITPISKVEDVRGAGEYLADRGIPFLLSVTPVYLNPKTEEKVLLSSNKKLVTELQSLQERGGVVIVNGYNHSYRLNEQFDGYEFWDMELNQSIAASPVDSLPLPIQQPQRFSSDQEYSNYRAADIQTESDMIHTKYKQGIKALVDLELYPMGVEVPQYTMSANGYAVTSDYFSALFGRIQVSDTDGRMINTPLFISKPGRLSGMTLYPETIGYVNPDLDEPFEDMQDTIKRLETVPGSVIGGFYHAYIGTSYLPEMIRLIESVPGMEWIDFSEMDHTVQTPEITIRHAAEGVQMTTTITKWSELRYMIQENPLDVLLWTIAFVVALFVSAFAIYVVNLRLRLKKRLFEERDQID